MKKILLLLIIGISFSAYSQVDDLEKDLKKKKEKKEREDGWLKGGVTTLTFSQTSLTNWAAGGENSISLNGMLNLFANYKKGNATWDNTLEIGYGLIRQGDNDFIKSDDKIDFASKYGQKAFGNDFYYAAMLNFRTQMQPGFNLPNDSVKISDFLAPAYLLGAIGMDYKPSDNLTLFIAPLTSKTTFVYDQTLANQGAFGVEAAEYDTSGSILLVEGKNVRNEIGGYLKFFWKKEIIENVTFQTKLDLFSNYAENPGNIDVNWESLLSMKVNKFITVNVITHLIYDDDVDIEVDENDDGVIDAKGPRTQFKEVFGLGFSYKF